MSARDKHPADGQSAPLGILARLWWMLGGNMLLAFSLIFIFRNEEGFFHPADWVFWITVATLVAIRYLDIRFLNGQTATDEKASMMDWVRYAVLLPVCATVLWATAHAANYLFGGRIAGS
jgi:hypothetical protein